MKKFTRNAVAALVVLFAISPAFADVAPTGGNPRPPIGSTGGVVDTLSTAADVVLALVSVA